MLNQQTNYSKQKKLSELGNIIKGTSYVDLSPWLQTKGASNVENNFKRPGPIEKEVKLNELGKMVRGR